MWEKDVPCVVFPAKQTEAPIFVASLQQSLQHFGADGRVLSSLFHLDIIFSDLVCGLYACFLSFFMNNLG